MKATSLDNRKAPMLEGGSPLPNSPPANTEMTYMKWAQGHCTKPDEPCRVGCTHRFFSVVAYRTMHLGRKNFPRDH